MSTDTKSKSIVDAVKNITDIIEELWKERNARRELEEELKTLKQQMKSQAPMSTKVVSTSSAKPLSMALAKLKELKDKEKKHNIVNIDKRESLHQYVARTGVVKRVENLTKLGLLNSDQLYSLFSDFWIDPKTQKLINKAFFLKVLRHAFHLPNSDHTTPILKAAMVRDNVAVVCKVACKKLPNPVNILGEIQEVDNPAYTSSKEPCVRFQVRYTSKAVDYLKDNWYNLLSSYLYSSGMYQS